MTEVNGMSCAEFADVAAELALGVLTGRERADALAHLDGCDACRESIRQLTATGEGLLGLLPAAEPAPGFETRVLERLGLIPPAPPVSHRRKDPAGRVRRVRWLLAAAAVVVALAGSGAGGWGLHGMMTPPRASAAEYPLASAAMVSTASHQAVGRVYVYTRSPEWLYVAVDLDNSGNGTVRCQVIGAQGQVTDGGSFRLAAGYGSWGSPVPGGGPLYGARLVSADGTVLATASFGKRSAAGSGTG